MPMELSVKLSTAAGPRLVEVVGAGNTARHFL
jgi:hypothetical protein